MDTKPIYDNLEGKLSQFWIGQKEVKISNKEINQYLMPFANLKYFAKADGSFLYMHNEQGLIRLDYEAIYNNSSELKILKKDGSFDKEKTNEYIDELFRQTNESFKKIKLISDFSNYSRLNSRFGLKHQATSYLPGISNGLWDLKNVSELPKIAGMYFINALNVVKKLAPEKYRAIDKNPNNNSIVSFLEICKEEYKSKGNDKFSMNNYLDEKIMNIISALDDIDREECGNPLMKNRATDLFVMYLSPDKKLFRNSLIDEKIFSRHASNDIKTYLETLKEKSEKK
jgi:hypothetical protein